MTSTHSNSQNSPATLTRRASKTARGLGVSRAAFSLVEVIITVALLAIVASLAIPNLTSVRTSAQRTKLNTDVTKLNQIITAYIAEGGSLTGVTDPQDVLDKLKTTRSAADARVHVGTMTGRAVDTRLAARQLSSTEKSSKTARAVWNATTLQFTVSTTSGQDGVSGFYLNDALAGLSYGTETRNASKVNYNKDDGWVWAQGQAPAAARLAPNDFLLASVAPASPFAPTAAGPPVVIGSSTIRPLPTPVITPNGGTLSKAAFPSVVTINPNGAPNGAKSLLKYQITESDGTAHAWEAYKGAVAIAPGQTVRALNATTDAATYEDSAETSQTYEALITDLPTPVISPPGGSYIATLFPSAVTIDANGAPGGSSSTLRYQVLHSDGTLKTWTTYSSAIAVTYGDIVTAKNFSTDTHFFRDSAPNTQNYQISVIKLPAPIITYAVVGGKRQVTITMDTSSINIPSGSYIQYTTDGSDPGIINDGPSSGQLYNSVISASSKAKEILVNARLYPPRHLIAAYDTSDMAEMDMDFGTGDSEVGPGLAGGHFDVDTSHKVYAAGSGTTDGHVHAYDDKYDVTGINMMNFHTTTLKNIQDVIPAGVRFKIIVSNGSLSTGGRLSINRSYNTADPASYAKVTDYQDVGTSSLPVYSTDGASGSTKLTALAVNFEKDAITNSGIMGTVTGAVRSNKAGANGEYRNGALTIQAVAVNADGSPAFTANTALSNGGVQGVAQSGLLWEATIFWHWSNGAY